MTWILSSGPPNWDKLSQNYVQFLQFSYLLLICTVYCLPRPSVEQGTYVEVVLEAPVTSWEDHLLLDLRVVGAPHQHDSLNKVKSKTRICASLGLRVKFKTLSSFPRAILICHSFLICPSNSWPGLRVWMLSVFKLVSCKPGSEAPRPEKLQIL